MSDCFLLQCPWCRPGLARARWWSTTSRSVTRAGTTWTPGFSVGCWATGRVRRPEAHSLARWPPTTWWLRSAALALSSAYWTVHTLSAPPAPVTRSGRNILISPEIIKYTRMNQGRRGDLCGETDDDDWHSTQQQTASQEKYHLVHLMKCNHRKYSNILNYIKL